MSLPGFVALAKQPRQSTLSSWACRRI